MKSFIDTASETEGKSEINTKTGEEIFAEKAANAERADKSAFARYIFKMYSKLLLQYFTIYIDLQPKMDFFPELQGCCLLFKNGHEPFFITFCSVYLYN